MKKTIMMANVWGLTAATLFVICAVIVMVYPGFVEAIFKTWTHGMDITILGVRKVTLGDFLFGGVTFTASAWGTGYLSGWFWNMLNKKK